jgi:hypothetical protein
MFVAQHVLWDQQQSLEIQRWILSAVRFKVPTAVLKKIQDFLGYDAMSNDYT